jgi:hypothetical protein
LIDSDAEFADKLAQEAVVGTEVHDLPDMFFKRICHEVKYAGPRPDVPRIMLVDEAYPHCLLRMLHFLLFCRPNARWLVTLR